MNPQSNLPPHIQYYLEEQRRKRNRNRLVIILVASVVLLAIWGHRHDKTFNHKKQQLDSLGTTDTRSNEENTDSIASTSAETSVDNDQRLSKDEIDRKASDAVAILDVYVKHHMNDPDSFEEVSYEYEYHNTYFIILLKYRGKNAFGAKVLNYIQAKTDLDGDVLEVISAT